MADSPQKRPGTMSDEDRALQHRARTPAHGVPIHVPHPEDFTPVTEVLALIERLPDGETKELLRDVAAKIWQHTANLRMRSDAQFASGDAGAVAALREEVNDLQARIVDISGTSGSNGKLGEVGRSHAALSSKIWWAATAIVGAIGFIAVRAIFIVRTFDAVEARTLHNAETIAVHEARLLNLEAARLARPRWNQPATEPVDRKDSP